jgi:hypothetical protein
MSRSPPAPPEIDETDPLWRQLRALPVRGPDDLARTRVQRRARALFARATRRDARWLARFDRWYGRLEPTLAVGISVVYLAWAVRVTAALLR